MESHKIALTKEQECLIEKLGRMNEKNGVQPAAARILALLMVSDSTELTFEQIHETLNISKSAASNAINLMLKMEQLDYVTHIGERKRYFFNKLMSWKENLKKNLDQIEVMGRLLDEVLVQRTDKTEDFNKQLKEVIDFMDFMTVEIPLLIQKWEEKNK